MKPFIYWSVNGIHVVNLLETWKKIDEVKKELLELSQSGKKILFVATKIQSRDSFKKLAIETWHYYVTEKWVPGLLTNFKTIRKRINSYLELLQDLESGALEILTKKEKAWKLLELEKLDKAYAWLKEMKKLPDLVFASDGIYEKQSLKEAEILNIKSYAIFNTNWDIDLVDNMIPANTNSPKSFDYIANELKSSIVSSILKEKKSVIKEIKQEKISGETVKKVVIKKQIKTPTDEILEVKEEIKENENVEIKEEKTI